MTTTTESRAFLLALLCAATGVRAQATASRASQPSPLAGLRDAFEAVAAEAPLVAIAVVGDREPLVLCGGRDAGGKPVGPLSLVPLGPIARLLVSDALETRAKGKLDVPGAKIGTRELTVRELLAGTDLLPDYWAWDGSSAVTAERLLACGEFALRTGARFLATGSGGAELELLAPFAFGDKPHDWAALLRSALAVQVPGFDPRSADALTEAERERCACALPAIASAQPRAFRLLATPRDLATWWRWRLRAGAEPELKVGPRAGRWERNGGRDERHWCFRSRLGESGVAIAYPERRAGLLCFGGRGIERLWVAFEADMLGAEAIDDEVEETTVAADATQGRPAWETSKGKAWRTAAAAGDACRAAVDGDGASLRLEWRGKTWLVGDALNERGEARLHVLQPEDATRERHLLYVVMAKDHSRLTLLLVETHGRLASLPHRFDLALEEK